MTDGFANTEIICQHSTHMRTHTHTHTHTHTRVGLTAGPCTTTFSDLFCLTFNPKLEGYYHDGLFIGEQSTDPE
jgi:hypothetical protein